jgi:hypothetical protein
LFDFDRHAHFSFSPNMQYIVQDKSVIAQARGGVDLHVYPACDQTCNITDAIYGGSSFSSTVTWTAESGVEYRVLVSSAALSSGSSIPNFELQILDTNDSCDNAFGPITPGVASFLLGSTLAGGTVNVAPSCGSASNATGRGAWYTIIGDGGAITASTCGTRTDFDSQISVFTGDSCDELTCVDGNYDACGSQSRVDFLSNQYQTYHVLVDGFGTGSGSFALQIIASRFASLDNNLCEEAHSIILGGDAIVASLENATKQDVVYCELPDQTPDSQPGLWYKVRGVRVCDFLFDIDQHAYCLLSPNL